MSQKIKRSLVFTLLFLIVLTLTACQTPENPETQPTETMQKPTEVIMSDYQKTDPALDDTINLLMIGNSGCYYYVEELYGLAEAAGIKMRICNVYYSGCTLNQHWTWWMTKEANYDYFTTDENGRVKAEGKVNLEWCLQQQNWDFISLQEGNTSIRSATTNAAFAARQMYLNDLVGYLKKQFPMSKFYWQQNGSYQIGYNRSFRVDSIEDQRNDTKKYYDFAVMVCDQYNLTLIPKGQASLLVKEGGYDNLCARLGIGTNHAGDYYHDGDIGGGQYLTACVWFEVLTGKSCIGNPYRPEYTYKGEKFTVDESLILKLQEAAHTAVQNNK